MKFQQYIREITGTIAYWISKSGEVVEVNSTHIDTIIKNPSKFGYTKQQIEALYEKHGEKVGVEGNAREEIILDLIGKGWIRVRRYKNDGYSVNIGKMNKKVKDILFDWASKLLNTGIKGMKEKDRYMPVKILGFKDNFTRSLTIGDIANDALFEGNEVFDIKNSVIILESAGDLHEPTMDDL